MIRTPISLLLLALSAAGLRASNEPDESKSNDRRVEFAKFIYDEAVKMVDTVEDDKGKDKKIIISVEGGTVKAEASTGTADSTHKWSIADCYPENWDKVGQNGCLARILYKPERDKGKPYGMPDRLIVETVDQGFGPQWIKEKERGTWKVDPDMFKEVAKLRKLSLLSVLVDKGKIVANNRLPVLPMDEYKRHMDEYKRHFANRKKVENLKMSDQKLNP